MELLSIVSHVTHGSETASSLLALLLASASDVRDARRAARTWIGEQRPVVRAAAHGCLAWLAHFIRTAGDSGRDDPVFQRALLAAIDNGRLRAVEMLLPLHGTHLDARADADRPMLRAAELGHAPIVARLLDDVGADVHVQDDEALCRAVTDCNDGMVATLLARGADPCAQQGILPYLAVHVNAPAELLERLLDAGAPLTANLVETVVVLSTDLRTVGLVLARVMRHPKLGTHTSWHDALVILGATASSAPVMRLLLQSPGADGLCLSYAMASARSSGNEDTERCLTTYCAPG